MNGRDADNMRRDSVHKVINHAIEAGKRSTRANGGQVRSLTGENTVVGFTDEGGDKPDVDLFDKGSSWYLKVPRSFTRNGEKSEPYSNARLSRF